MDNAIQPSEQTIPELTKRVLSLGTKAPKEDVAAMLDLIACYKRRIKEVDDLFEKMAIEWVEANGDLDIGNGIRYYVGTPSTTKCIDKKTALVGLLEATAGDVDALCEHLASDPIKHGAARKTLPPEVYAKCFETTTKKTLEEGKPKKRLLAANDRFTK